MFWANTRSIIVLTSTVSTKLVRKFLVSRCAYRGEGFNFGEQHDDDIGITCWVSKFPSSGIHILPK